MKSKDTYQRSRIEILNYIINFSTIKYYGQGSFNSVFHKDGEKSFMFGEPPIGSLVKLTSAGFSKYYLSWLLQIRSGGLGKEYLLKSIDDGSLCWWSNVGLDYYDPSTVSDFPQWKWTDKQFEVSDRWFRAGKRCDAYIIRCCYPEFTEDGGIILRTRRMFNMDAYRAEKKFDDWNKVLLRDMIAWYKEACALHESNRISILQPKEPSTDET